MEKTNWKGHLAAWESSGQSKKKYCEEKGLSYQSFVYHFSRSKISKEDGFSQVQISNPAMDHEKIDYHFADGRTVSFPCQVPKELIRFILSI